MQQAIDSIENPIISNIAITYLGPSDFGKKYGDQMFPNCESTVTEMSVKIFDDVGKAPLTVHHCCSCRALFGGVIECGCCPGVYHGVRRETAGRIQECSEVPCRLVEGRD
jgi:hypothetical protein